MNLSKSVCGFFKGNCLGLQKFLPTDSIPADFYSQKLWELNLPGTGNLGWGPDVGLGLLTPKILLPNFYLPHVDVGPACSTFPPLLTVWMDVVSLIP